MATVQWAHSEGSFRITYSVTVASNNTLTVNITKLEISPTYYTGYFYPDCKIQVNGVTALTMDCNEQATHRANCTSTGSYHTVTNYRATPTGSTTTASVSGIAIGSAITISCVGNNYSSGNSVYMYYKNINDACFTISNTSTNTGTPTVYTVSYNANGGTGAPSAQKKATGQNITLSSTKPTKASTSSSCTVTYNANGGSVSPTSATSSRTTTYTFKNWNTNSGGTGTSYNAGAAYTANATVTLYAQYTSSTGAYSTVTLPTPTRSGYSFLGWAASSTATQGNVGSYTPTGNVTLYAIWAESSKTITIKHYMQDVGGGSTLFSTETINVSSATFTPTTITPRDGNTSTGASYTYWSADESKQLGIGIADSVSFSLTENHIVYINYPLTTYNLSISANNAIATILCNGATLVNGSKITYGDVLRISFMPKKGYMITEHLINNAVLESGASIVVDGDISIIISAAAGRTEIFGFAYIKNDLHEVYIKHNEAYTMYIPYVYTGNNWKVCK